MMILPPNPWLEGFGMMFIFLLRMGFMVLIMWFISSLLELKKEVDPFMKCIDDLNDLIKAAGKKK